MSENNRLYLKDFDDNITKLQQNLEFLKDKGAQAGVTDETQLRIDNTVWLFEKILEQADKLMRMVLRAHGVSKSSLSEMAFKKVMETAAEMEFIDEETLSVLSDFWELRNDSTYDYLSARVGNILETAPSLIPVAEKLNALFSDQVPLEQEPPE